MHLNTIKCVFLAYILILYSMFVDVFKCL